MLNPAARGRTPTHQGLDQYKKLSIILLHLYIPVIDLSKYCIRVTSDYERLVAINFYIFATQFPLAFSLADGMYVGISYFCNVKQNTIICSDSPDENETIIGFNQISDLADTPSRVAALQKARAGYVNPNQDKEI